MAEKILTRAHGLNGTLTVPGDKSISHRALLFGSVAHGTTTIHGLLRSEDVLHTLGALRDLGVTIEDDGQTVTVVGQAGFHFQQPIAPLQMGNSGTTTRLLMGLLAQQSFEVTLIGDASLSKRPMTRVSDPLALMGANIDVTDGHLPVTLKHSALQGIDYTLPVASAQVKSALILAGLQATGTTVIREPLATRDHTERMLAMFGRPVTREDEQILVTPSELTATQVDVPADISSAAFWLVAGLIVPNSHVTLTKVGMNPTRTGIITLLKRMQATIEVTDLPVVAGGEPLADLSVVSQNLMGTMIVAADIPSVIDELPILVLAATQATGVTRISGAAELRVKETDRIAAVTTELNKLGAQIEATEDGFIIHGGTPLHAENGVVVDAHGDHRIGMMLAIAAQITTGEVTLTNAQSVAVSYPTFFADLAQLRGEA
ncbi:MAG TPA: 3-phosphoshikimate 1-carboxyvinyltransferase [Lactobacillaceae bacterium]|jgi:3-phosphoshikimate 1-carboxyvinyltransferase